MTLSKEDSFRQTIADREARVSDNRKDRLLRAFTSLLSALVAIAAAYFAFLKAIEQINAPTKQFEVVVVDTKSSKQAIRVNTHSGETWLLKVSEDGIRWVDIPPR